RGVSTARSRSHFPDSPRRRDDAAGPTSWLRATARSPQGRTGWAQPNGGPYAASVPPAKYSDSNEHTEHRCSNLTQHNHDRVSSCHCSRPRPRPAEAFEKKICDRFAEPFREPRTRLLFGGSAPFVGKERLPAGEATFSLPLAPVLI